jgi:hypothetical protein
MNFLWRFDKRTKIAYTLIEAHLIQAFLVLQRNFFTWSTIMQNLHGLIDGILQILRDPAWGSLGVFTSIVLPIFAAKKNQKARKIQKASLISSSSQKLVRECPLFAPSL